MTTEEMERAIEFLIQSQASVEQRLEETNRQIVQTGKQIETLADSQNDLTRTLTRYIEAQDRINSSVQHSIRDLASTVERYISEGRNGK